MPVDIPHVALSDHFQECLVGRRLVSAVFLTFQLDPAFFELQVLPVFLDISVSHADRMRSIQLEDALRELRGHIAVYYDAHGLLPGSGSAKLDIRRIAMRRANGIFHPKNVFLLVEAIDADDDGIRARSLIVASLSANLTRSGWWENVEACHVEKIDEGDRSLIRADLLEFFRTLKRTAGVGASEQHEAVDDIAEFVRTKTFDRENASYAGRLHTRFFDGKGDVVAFLKGATGSRLRGMSLEIISPYFDDAPTSAPLRALVDAFEPAAVRIFLPRTKANEGICRDALYDDVRSLPNTSWGHLPREMLRFGKGNETESRFVHAKIYRFFDSEHEIVFVGSANLTRAAHRGQNVETGFLVELPKTTDGFWLAKDQQRPTAFVASGEDKSPAASGGSRLDLRYHWGHRRADACWHGSGPSPDLQIIGGGVTVGTLGALTPETWTTLDSGFAVELEKELVTRSIFEVHGEAPTPTLLLVREEGMAKKPSQLFTLTTAEIMKFWALLTAGQRSAFLESRAPELAATEEGADLVHHARLVFDEQTFFDRFAGVFHAFACLESAVVDSLENGNGREARYRLFGKKYDSLGTLLECVLDKEDVDDDVVAYVTLLCAEQVCRRVQDDYADFWNDPESDGAELRARLEQRAKIRSRIEASDPEKMPAFLTWFDQKFLQRARAAEAAS